MITKTLFYGIITVLVLGIGLSAIQNNMAMSGLHDDVTALKHSLTKLIRSTDQSSISSACAVQPLTLANSSRILSNQQIQAIAAQIVNQQEFFQQELSQQEVFQQERLQEELPHVNATNNFFPRIEFPAVETSAVEPPAIAQHVIESALVQIETIRSRGSLSQTDIFEIHSQLAQLDASNHRRVVPELLDAIGNGEIALEDGVVF